MRQPPDAPGVSETRERRTNRRLSQNDNDPNVLVPGTGALRLFRAMGKLCTRNKMPPPPTNVTTNSGRTNTCKARVLLRCAMFAVTSPDARCLRQNPRSMQSLSGATANKTRTKARAARLAKRVFFRLHVLILSNTKLCEIRFAEPEAKTKK